MLRPELEDVLVPGGKEIIAVSTIDVLHVIFEVCRPGRHGKRGLVVNPVVCCEAKLDEKFIALGRTEVELRLEDDDPAALIIATLLTVEKLILIRTSQQSIDGQGVAQIIC